MKTALLLLISLMSFNANAYFDDGWYSCLNTVYNRDIVFEVQPNSALNMAGGPLSTRVTKLVPYTTVVFENEKHVMYNLDELNGYAPGFQVLLVPEAMTKFEVQDPEIAFAQLNAAGDRIEKVVKTGCVRIGGPR